MKEIEVETRTKDGSIVLSDKVKIDENSDRIKVIVSVGDKDIHAKVSKEQLDTAHQSITDAIRNEVKVITVPWYVKINTIKI